MILLLKVSIIYAELNINFDELTLEEILPLLNEHRSLLRSPIVIDDKRIQVGFNDNDIRKFIPRKIRTKQKTKTAATISEL